MNPSKSFAWRLAALLAILGALALVAGCGDDDSGNNDSGNGDAAEAEAPSGPLTLDQIKSNLEDAGYYANPLDEGELAATGALAGLEVGSEDDDGGFFGGNVYEIPDPAAQQALVKTIDPETVEIGEDGFVFTTYGPGAAENLPTLVEAAQGG